MGEKYQAYRSMRYPLPEINWAWNLYGQAWKTWDARAHLKLFRSLSPVMTRFW